MGLERWLKGWDRFVVVCLLLFFKEQLTIVYLLLDGKNINK